MSGCATSPLPKGGEISLPGGVNVRQPDNARTPASARITYVYDPIGDPIFQRSASGIAAQVRRNADVNSPHTMAPAGGFGPSIEGGAPGMINRTPAGQIVVDVSTGVSDVMDATAVETAKVEARARQPLMYGGIACVIIGLLVATLLRYPTPGGLLALCGGALIGMHSYPWLGLIAAALGAAAVGIYVGYEAAERKVKGTSPSATA